MESNKETPKSEDTEEWKFQWGVEQREFCNYAFTWDSSGAIERNNSVIEGESPPQCYPVAALHTLLKDPQQNSKKYSFNIDTSTVFSSDDMPRCEYWYFYHSQVVCPTSL